MCLAIPMQISRIQGCTAHCEARGVAREASLYLLADEALAEGDFVLIHLGYAIQKLSAEEAHSTWELLDQMEGLTAGA